MGIWLWEFRRLESLLACSPLYKLECDSRNHMSIHHLPHLVDSTSLRWVMKLKCSKFLGLESTYDRILFDALCGFVSEISYSLFRWMVGTISSCKRFLQWMQPCNKSCLEIDVRLWRSFVTACSLSWVNNIVGQWEQHLRIFGYGYIIAGGNYAQPQHRNSSSVVFIPANKFLKYVRQSWVC